MNLKNLSIYLIKDKEKLIITCTNDIPTYQVNIPVFSPAAINTAITNFFSVYRKSLENNLVDIKLLNLDNNYPYTIIQNINPQLYCSDSNIRDQVREYLRKNCIKGDN